MQRLASALTTCTQATRAWRALLALLIVTVLYLALAPRPPAAVDFGWDKLNHTLAFAALGFCACLGYPASRTARLRWLFALLALGSLIEILQQSVPSRSSEWGDLLADAFGIVCGAVIAAAVLRAAAWGSRRVARPG